MHPNESRWREMLDGEIDAHHMPELTEHLSSCQACTALIARLRREREEAAALLQMLEGPTSRARLEGILRRTRRPSWRGRALIAAGVGLFLVTVAGATIRSGTLHRWMAGPGSQSSPVTSRAPAPPIQNGASPNGIAFQVDGTVTISFDAPQDAGDLLITISPDSNVSIVASETVRYALRSGDVRVANRGVTADYRVTLPDRLEHVSIRVAGRMVFTKTGATVLTSARQEGGQRYLVSLTGKQRTSP